MDQFSYLPFVQARGRVHCDVTTIPISDQGSEDGDEGADQQTLISPKHEIIGGEHYIADQITPVGCLRFCTESTEWKCFVALRVSRTWFNTAFATPPLLCRIPFHDSNVDFPGP
jgi:hypothetical protein